MACFSSQHGLPTGIASCLALGDAVALHAAIGSRGALPALGDALLGLSRPSASPCAHGFRQRFRLVEVI